MAQKARRRYSWALYFAPGDPELRGLSEKARSGLEYATELAEAARERRLSALEGLSDAPLTIDELARRDDRSPIHLQSEIKQARVEIFGKDLTDSAISYRLKKRRQRRERLCAETDCRRMIPALASGRRRYCDLHAGGAARVRRHRQMRAGAGISSSSESPQSRAFKPF